MVNISDVDYDRTYEIHFDSLGNESRLFSDVDFDRRYQYGYDTLGNYEEAADILAKTDDDTLRNLKLLAGLGILLLVLCLLREPTAANY